MRSVLAIGVLAIIAVGCAGGKGRSGFDEADKPKDVLKSNEDAPASSAPAPDLGEAKTEPGQNGKRDVDDDGDGYSEDDGDCNDNDPNANPGALDVAGNNVDEDCSGKPDDEVATCDGNLAVASPDAYEGAKAIGLCRRAQVNATGKQRTWGVLSARYVKPDGMAETVPVSHGILAGFGTNSVQEGTRMLVLSTGTARQP